MMSPVQPDCASAHRARRGFQRGFTMIEALVTFVILAVGLLGIVTLMTTSKTTQYEALQRTRAVALADSMLERIRENPDGLDIYETHDGDNPVGQGLISAPANDCSGNCNPDEMAAYDLWVWEQQLDGERVAVTDGGAATAGLKAARGCILFDLFDDYVTPSPRPGTGRITVLVQWEGLQESVDAVADPNATDAVCGDDTASNPRRRQVAVRSFVVHTDDLE